MRSFSVIFLETVNYPIHFNLYFILFFYGKLSIAKIVSYLSSLTFPVVASCANVAMIFEEILLSMMIVDVEHFICEKCFQMASES